MTNPLNPSAEGAAPFALKGAREKPKLITAHIYVRPDSIEGRCVDGECSFTIGRAHKSTHADLANMMADLAVHREAHGDTHKGRMRIDFFFLDGAKIK